MDIKDRKGLKAEAAYQLSQASYNPRLLALIHIGVSTGAGLLVAVINYLLQMKIGTTGGLSGVTLRSTLEMVQSVLNLIVSVLTPFWAVGIVYAAIRLARGQRAEPKTLLAGFSRWGAILRLRILQVLIFMALTIPCAYISSFLFVYTPLGNLLVKLISPSAVLAAFPEFNMPEYSADTGMAVSVMVAAIIMIPIFLIVYLAVLLPVFYRIRFAEYIILDQENSGARQSLSKSWQMTKGYGWSLFKLDLSYWWFYGLHILALLLTYVDVIFPTWGAAVYILAFVLYVVAELAIYWGFSAHIQTTYAVAYDTLRQQYADMQSAAAPWQTPEETNDFRQTEE